MSDAQRVLPPGFETLERFVGFWAVEGAANRDRCRSVSSSTERSEFFNAAKDLVPAALTLLDSKLLDQHDESERRLMNLLLSFAHVSLAVELQGDAESQHARDRFHMRITKAPSDAGARARS